MVKPILLCGLLFLSISGFGHGAAPADDTNVPSPSEAGKERAMVIHDALMGMAHGGDASPAAWDAVDAKIDAYRKEFGESASTTHVIVLLRKMELAVARKLGDSSRYNTVMQKFQADPVPDVAAAAKSEQEKTTPP